MLYVRVELWPGGDSRQAQVLGAMTIASQSDLAEVNDYSVVKRDAVEDQTSWHTVRGHRRGQGFWALVSKAIEVFRPEGGH